LRVYAEALQSRDSKLMLVGVDPALRDQLAKTGVLKLIGEENVFAATSQFGGAMNKAAADASLAWATPGRSLARRSLSAALNDIPALSQFIDLVIDVGPTMCDSTVRLVGHQSRP